MTTLAVQAAGIAIIATGMVMIIVSRNIDLSVGSLVGIIAMTYALLMTDWLPALGLGSDVPFNWAIALGLGILMGAAIGGVQGFIIAYIGVPSFIVTLGGLLSIRGAVWYLSSGHVGIRTRSDVPAPRRGRAGIHRRHVDLGPRPHRQRGDRRPAHQLPAPASPLRVPGPADVGRDPDRGRRHPRGPRRRLVRQQQLLAEGPGRPGLRGSGRTFPSRRAGSGSRPASRTRSSC